MSQNKKYYWLKLNSDFFDDETIRYIEEQENGIKYSNFYLKLCLKSLKTEGKLIRLVGETLIPYDINSLAQLTGVNFDTVRCAMELFTKIGLIKILDSGEIYLSQINEMIGSETDKAKMMRLRRATNVEIKPNGNNVTQVLPKCYPEIDIDIEKEKEIEIDTECREEKKVTTYNQGAFKYFEQNIDALTPKTAEMIEDYQKDMQDDLICYAIDKAVMAKKRNPSYVFGILRNWSNKGIKTILMAKEEEQDFKKVSEEPKKEDKWASFISEGDG